MPFFALDFHSRQEDQAAAGVTAYGRMVDMQNLTEVQTFQRYVAEMKASPESKAMLLDYYWKGVEATATTAGQPTTV